WNYIYVIYMGKLIICVLLPFAVGVIMSGCGSKANTAVKTDTAVNATASSPRELALPEVPESITDPEDRAAYAVGHFWDSLDPGVHAQSLDTAFMEQTFANFIGLLPYAPEQAREQAVGAFADKCSADAAVYDLAVYIARHYLDDPNSPMRNEELYIPFLRRFAGDTGLSEAKRERAAYRLEQAMKNRPGSRATDFGLVTREGRTSTLLRELGDTTLVVFYDYDCEHCKETVARLEDPAMGVRYPVMAVEVTEDREGWDSTKAGMPTGWKVCFATDPLDGEGYYFPALPSIYLLAGDGTVIIKDGAL
ncbi:MAG: DUF5106 domain-containing protein, partial [Muribaculaceae bacterium]|nr:DUF5106 domain-containing protein [Muribaculaceae bacterium]